MRALSLSQFPSGGN
uniref:Uncharacterized protein n=1 Tax=Anguilla anguilla TaxID=7936 RepID=A0A0E9XV39_ANGAN